MDDTPTPHTDIDWKALHARLAATNERLTRGGAPTAEGEAAILSTRARQLAQTAAPAAAAGDQLEIVEFRLAHERYGLESRYVREVYPLRELTPLPGTPPFVLGLVNVRGQIVAVLDLKRFFDLPDHGLTDLNKLIILTSGELIFGVLADAVMEVRAVAQSDLQRTLPTLGGLRAEFTRGVTPERLIVLDAARLLESRELRVHDEGDG
jgi:purine-binding chemotaxis protein CheW